MRGDNQTWTSIAFGLGGGALGLVAGGKIGYEVAYERDIQRGCEDCGLGGLLRGATIGLFTELAWGVPRRAVQPGATARDAPVGPSDPRPPRTTPARSRGPSLVAAPAPLSPPFGTSRILGEGRFKFLP
jgi:hypothetical protein